MTMDEYKAKAVQTLNVSEIGFNPYDYLAQSTHPTGEAYWYIPLNIQIKWFRAVYPQRRHRHLDRKSRERTSCDSVCVR